MSISEFNEWDEIKGLHMNILRGVYGYGFEHPSPIQKKAIIPLMDGKDVIAQAQSGTGKTGCFTVGALHHIDCDRSQTQVVIIAPTRELSQQIKTVVDSIGKMMSGLKTQLLVGGTSIEYDSNELTNNTPHIVIGCPGRIYDMIMRKQLKMEHVKMIALDEADEMLSYGFKDQIYNIFQYLPNDVQVCLFSATMPYAITAMAEKFMREPVKIIVKAEQLTLEGIAQYYVALDTDEHKFEALKDLYGVFSLSQCIIYCNSVGRVQELYDAMQRENFPVSQIHSSMTKEERNASFNQFKIGSTRVLISSNVTARGIDVQQVSTVINFDIPKDVHTYLHRIGRSGRWGRKGTGINFVTRRDIRNMKNIEKYYSTEIKELPADVVAQG